MVRRTTIALTLSLGFVTVTGCAPAFVVRTAETARKGEFAGQFTAYPVHVGWGDAVVRSAPKGTVPARVFTAGGDLHPTKEANTIFGGTTGLYQFDFRYGLSDRVEAGVFLGGQRVGGEIRGMPVAERAGHPLSIATSFGFAYEALGDGPFVRAGVDISHRWGGFVPFVNAYISRGFSEHGAHVGDFPCPPEGYPGTVCGVEVHEFQDEVRVSFGVGASVRADKVQAVFGVEPYLPIALAPLQCAACGLVRPLWGMYFMGGMAFGGEPDP